MSIRQRIASVDILRGLVMIIMAIDHVRNYFSTTPVWPEQLADPGLALFLTRWITHYCAPTFVFLCGVSACLHAYYSQSSTPDLRTYLIKRGAWLIIVEVLIVNAVWPLWMDGTIMLQVIWAIAWSMIALAVALPLGRKAILGIGLGIVFMHNLFDVVSAGDLGMLEPLWLFLHERGNIELGGGWRLLMLYPVLPWIGTMFIGFAAGHYLVNGSNWQRLAFRAGAMATALFFVLRMSNLYGDPADFIAADNWQQSLINFLNVQKYPPSLQYLLMTLGPGLMLMPILENWRGRVAAWISVFGQVPFFYYVLHFTVIYIIGIAWSLYRYGYAFWWYRGEAAFPPDYQFALWPTYAVWAALIIALYPACHWYARFRRERRDLWWLSYV